MNRIGGIIASVKLSLTLRKRKAARIIEQQRAKQAYWEAVRKHHARDPLWRGVA
jgi:hypothetical protein